MNGGLRSAVLLLGALERVAGHTMATQALLAVQNIEVIYDHVILVLKDVSLDVTKGQILNKGERIDRLDPAALVKRGICQVMEGRHCFQHLTVEENLLTGAYTRGYLGSGVREELEKVYGYFPRLKERRHSQSGYTSGGEQQMTAIGRALMALPKMILLDEPSMGLAPQLVEEIFEIVKQLNREEKVSFLLAEQNTNIALRYAGYS